MLFKENGLPDKTINNGHVLYFGNFNGYKFDLAIVYPDDTIEYHYDIETDINWDAYDANNGISPSVQRRSVWDVFKKDPIGHALGGITCIAQFWVPPLAYGCATYIASTVGKVVIELIPADGFTKNVSNAIIDLGSCATIVVPNPNPLDLASAANSCISFLTGTVDVLKNDDLDLTDEKKEQINEAIRKIEGDALTTTIPRELLEYFLLLGIDVNSGRNPPNIEGTYLATPLQLVKNTSHAYSGNIAEQWDMYVTFSGQNNARLTVDANYTQQSDNGPMSSGGASVITGAGNKFTIFMEGTRVESGYTARTVEVYSGEITVTGIRNFQWAVFMINNNGDPLGHWIENGTGYFKKDRDGFSEKAQGPSPSIRKSRNMLPSEGILRQ
jgi:hypothetical protein